MNDKYSIPYALKRKPPSYFNILLSCLFIFSFMGCTKQKIDTDTTLEEFTDYMNRRIPSLMREYGIPGATIAVVKKGDIVWTHAYGYADLEKGRRMTNDTYCRVESISKSVTAWGVMKLAEQGRINLDSPLVDYLKSWKLPESKFSEEKITIRQLLSQQSGMPLGTIGVRYSPTAEKPTLKEQLSKDAILFQEPGQSFSYSNTGFNLLELLIEELTAQDFNTYMRENVLIPLGMHHSSYSWSDNFKPEVPNGYDSNNKPIPVYVYPDKASGGLFATVDDIANFIIAGMPAFSEKRLEVLRVQSIEKLYEPEVELSGYYGFVFDYYGFGHFIETLPNGLKSVSHGGQGSGWMTHFQSVPQTGDGIVILTNSQRSWPFFGYVLTDWAEWNGFPSIGMGKIVQVIRVLWIFIGSYLFFLAWRMRSFVQEIALKKRRLTVRSGNHLGLRWIQFSSSILLVLAVLWAKNQSYFFAFSVFPIVSNWLIGLFLLTAIILIMFFLFPINKEVQVIEKPKK